MLLGAPPHLDVSKFDITEIHNTEEMNGLIKKHNWDGVVRTRFWPNGFRRMLAKIGYSYFTALAGYGEFEPLILNAIKDEKFNISYLVGQNPETEPTIEGPWFNLRIKTKHWLPTERSFFVVEIRLFQSNPTPTYHVVVGQVHSTAQYKRAMENIRNSGRVEVPSPGA